MQKSEMSSSSASSDEKPGPNQSAFWWLIGLATLLLLGSALFAWKQPPNPNINPNTNRTAASGWIDTLQYPLEQNVFKRVAVINADLQAVFAVDQRVWAVGDRGLIVYGEDGGKSWERQTSDTGKSLYSITFQADGQQAIAVQLRPDRKIHSFSVLHHSVWPLECPNGGISDYHFSIPVT